jgi:hypothetical protein
VLRRIHRALIDELETTEMYLTLFYGVIDPTQRRIDYANAGHHHAFRIDAAGQPHRLGVTNPPFGMVDLDAYAEERRPSGSRSRTCSSSSPTASPTRSASARSRACSGCSIS